MTTDDASLPLPLALLVAAWLGYFVLHSLLASLASVTTPSMRGGALRSQGFQP